MRFEDKQLLMGFTKQALAPQTKGLLIGGALGTLGGPVPMVGGAALGYHLGKKRGDASDSLKRLEAYDDYDPYDDEVNADPVHQYMDSLRTYDHGDDAYAKYLVANGILNQEDADKHMQAYLQSTNEKEAAAKSILDDAIAERVHEIDEGTHKYEPEARSFHDYLVSNNILDAEQHQSTPDDFIGWYYGQRQADISNQIKSLLKKKYKG